MKDNIREYQTIKFFRGSKRNSTEMQRLADSGLDFEYRRILIVENELDLHVFFSRMFVFNWLSWSFLTLAICSWLNPTIASMLYGMALTSRITSVYYTRRFRLTFWRYNFAISIVDAVIYNDYGIRLS